MYCPGNSLDLHHRWDTSCLYFSYTDIDSTLTLQNVLIALKNMDKWSELGQWLNIPYSRSEVMTGKESMLKEWLQNHPAPSWKLIAWALYRSRGGQLTEHNVLKQLYRKHVTGMLSVYTKNTRNSYMHLWHLQGLVILLTMHMAK